MVTTPNVPSDYLRVIPVSPKEWSFKFPRLDDRAYDVFHQALKDMDAGQFRQAERDLRLLVKGFPEFIDAYHHLALLLERKSRSIIQGQKNVSYIFFGSRKHVVQKMFLDRSRPLYRAAAHFPLGPIQEEDWLPFIRERFTMAKKWMSNEQIHTVCRSADGHPFYTQQFLPSLDSKNADA